MQTRPATAHQSDARANPDTRGRATLDAAPKEIGGAGVAIGGTSPSALARALSAGAAAAALGASLGVGVAKRGGAGSGEGAGGGAGGVGGGGPHDPPDPGVVVACA